MKAKEPRFTTRDRDLNDLSFLAATICQVPIAMIAVETVGASPTRTVFYPENSPEVSEVELAEFFGLCVSELTLIPDAREHELLRANAGRSEELTFVFYAAITLRSPSGGALVRLAVFDRRSRHLEDAQVESLKRLARQVVNLLELSESVKQLTSLEEVHRETRQRLHKVIDAAEVGMWELCIDTDEFRYSDRWAQILGYDSRELGEITRAHSEAFVHPVDFAESTKAMEDYQAGILPRYECELRMKHKKGYWVWVLVRGQYVTDEGEYQGKWLVGTIKDTSEQVVANEQIYVREKRFQILLENSEDAIIILNETYRPHFETESVGRIFGIRGKESITQPITALVHPEDIAEFEAWFQKSLQEPKRPIKGPVTRMRNADGTWRHISGTLTNLLDDPIVKGLIYNFKDVTEQVSAENLRQRIENRYRKLAQEGADLVVVLDELGKFNYVSPNFSAYVGITEQEALSSNILTMIHPEDVRRITADFAWLLKTKTVRTKPFRFCHQQSEWRWVQSVATNLLDDPDVRGIVVNSADVTSVISAHQALEQSNERFRLVLQAGSESIYDYDLVTKAVFLSETFEEMFGISVDTEHENYQTIERLVHPDDLSKNRQQFREALENPKISVWTREYRLMKGDGTYAFVRDRSIKVMDESGRAIRVVGALMDISEVHFFQKLLEIEKDFIESSIVGGIEEEELYLTYLAQLESLIPDMRSSLSRVVEDKLCHAISPSLPKEYLQRIENLPLGNNQGSCGTAAFLNQNVFVTDVFQDPRWADHHELARAFNIGACWSFPIVNTEGKVVATVANYYSTPRKVGERELQALERAHRLISLLMAQFDNLEKIRLSNERYEIVNKTTNDAIFEWDVQNDRFYWGETLQRVFGHDYSGEVFNLQTWISLMHPSDEQAKAEEWNDFLADKDAHQWKNHFRFLKGDGSIAFVEESAHLIRDERGRPLRMIGVLRDSTELKKMEILLANASKLSKVGGWEVDVITRRQVWSRTTCEIHEVPPDYVPAIEEGIQYYRADHREKVIEAINLAVEKGEKIDFEAPIITANGRECWVRVIGEAEFLDGRCIRIIGSLQDIHERKRMEERLKSVSDSIPGVIFQYILHPDGGDEFRYVSKGSIQLLGLTPEECMADSRLAWAQAAQGGELERVINSLQDSAKTLNYWTCEWRVLSPQGKIEWREGLGKPVRKIDGTVVWDALIMDVTDRKKLESLLEQSTRMAKIGSWELDLSTKPYRFNGSNTTAAILEISKTNGIALDEIMDGFVGDSREIARNRIENLIQNGIGFDEELELNTGSGNPKWIRCIGHAQQVKGEIISAVGSIQDIHERKLSELNLKSLLLERNTILESIGDGFFAIDRNYIVTYWNKQAEKLLKMPRENIVGKNLWTVLRKTQWYRFHDNFRDALESGNVFYFEDYLADFQSWFSISAFPSESGLTVYFKDVTENKKAQEEIRQSNDRFERVSEATNDAIWDYQISEDRLYWGKGFTTLFGYDFKKINPTWQFSIDQIHPEDRERVMATFHTAQEDPNTSFWNEEYRFQKVDGSFAYVIDRVVFSRNENGEAVRAIGAISDITEQKKFEASLKNLNKNLKQQATELAISNAELEQFAYVASHDLQEPLRMVSSFLSQLDRKYKDKLDDKAQKYIHFAVDGAIRMRQVILDLLEYSRIGKEEHHLERVDLEEVIFEVTQLQAQLIKKKKAKIRFEGDTTIVCYKSPILQVFQNLIGNALKYSKDDVPPVIDISCREEKNQWMFSVKDNGIGIREEYFSKIFVIFQRLHAKQEYTGTGLGLAIVKKIVEGLGGKIWLESELNVGTTFHFTISKFVK
jgi:PAS domain S-box-containing protein